jgi:2-amino-4-hydroxy-6-hydroxymethyldihydropteridine diphosphokinase/dihydropteroate synthase
MLRSPAAHAASAAASAAVHAYAAASAASPSSVEVVLALGSNMGDRVRHITDALMRRLPSVGVHPLRTSLLYETAPVGGVEQPPYLNAAVLARTDLSALQVLYHAKQIERGAGRDVGPAWGGGPTDGGGGGNGGNGGGTGGNGNGGSSPTGGLPNQWWRGGADLSSAPTPVPMRQPQYNLAEHPKRWGPRPLDIDIVFYGPGQAGDGPGGVLCVPHPRWRERAFVKAPLADLLLPEDERRGYLFESDPRASVLPRLSEAAACWERDGGEALVGEPGLIRVTPVQRQLWRMGRVTHVFGVLNATPDSFSGDGLLAEEAGGGGASSSSAAPSPAAVAAAVERARAMWRAGAAAVDVGGQSTRPGSARVGPEEEAARILPLIRALREDSEMVHVPISVDTFYPSVAEAAVAAGADLVNDVSGGLDLFSSQNSNSNSNSSLPPGSSLVPPPPKESGMLETVARLGVPYVLMHTRGEPATMQQPAFTAYDDDGGGGVALGPGGTAGALGGASQPHPVVSGVGKELLARARAALAAGVLPWNLVLDPGLGFAKKPADSAALLGELDVLRARELPGVFGRLPVLIGPSRKRFLGELLAGGGEGGGDGVGAALSAAAPPPPEERDDATAAACVAGVARGAEMVRVHNVPLVSRALRVADALLRRGRAQQAQQERPPPAIGGKWLAPRG